MSTASITLHDQHRGEQQREALRRFREQAFNERCTVRLGMTLYRAEQPARNGYRHIKLAGAKANGEPIIERFFAQKESN